MMSIRLQATRRTTVLNIRADDPRAPLWMVGTRQVGSPNAKGAAFSGQTRALAPYDRPAVGFAGWREHTAPVTAN